jgi:REP element-mobilizing transposase RayT
VESERRFIYDSRPEGVKDRMPGTFSQILLHVVFATKHRQALLTPEIQPRLYDYIGGIVRAEKGVLYAIGGMPDHLHMLLRWRTDRAVGDLMRAVKAGSCLWVHQTFPRAKGFAWQEGYSVFSVSKSAEADVKAYIARQAEHHRRRDFKEEMLALLRAHGVTFDERYVFD